MGEVTQIVTFKKAGSNFIDKEEGINQLLEDMNAFEYISVVNTLKFNGQYQETFLLSAPDTLILTREWNLKSEYDSFVEIDFSEQRQNLENLGWTITDG